METTQEIKSWPYPVDEGHMIVPAFQSGGIQYYMMKDIFNSFSGRAMDALSIYEKFSMRSTPEFMRKWLDALENTINANPIKITDVAEMINVMRERVNFALPSESIIWELAAVAFFDDAESPYRYDDAYGKEKIERWKQDKNLPDFFFATPLKDLVSFPDLSEDALKNYLMMVEKVEAVQLEKVFSKLSSNPLNRDF